MIDAKIHTSIIITITAKIFFILTPLFYILIILHFKKNVNSFSKKFLWYFMEKRPGKMVKNGNYGVNKWATRKPPKILLIAKNFLLIFKLITILVVAVFKIVIPVVFSV